MVCFSEGDFVVAEDVCGAEGPVVSAAVAFVVDLPPGALVVPATGVVSPAPVILSAVDFSEDGVVVKPGPVVKVTNKRGNDTLFKERPPWRCRK